VLHHTPATRGSRQIGVSDCISWDLIFVSSEQVLCPLKEIAMNLRWKKLSLH
jgi:hypothetical protein